MDVSEIDLIAKCMTGDLNAYGILIDHYSKQVYNMLLRILGNEEDAKDVSQEVFIKVYKKLHTFKGKSEFTTWLYRIAMNSAKDYSRKKKSDVSLDERKDSGHEIIDYRTKSPEATYVEGEKRDFILKGLMLLKEEQREIIVLRDIQGLSYEEISVILNISLGTVKSRINRARMRLREILTEASFSL